MVVFTCNNCGESLQKPRVEKHYLFSCRSGKNLTCVDCLKDFGDEYVQHTKCVTELERYSAKGSMPIGIPQKGERKQESWLEMINSIVKEDVELKVPLRNLLNGLANYNNVPRKKKKFINFVKSSTGGRVHLGDIEAVWDIIEDYKNKSVIKKSNDTNTNDNTKKEMMTDENEKGEHNNPTENGPKIDNQKKKKKRENSNECNAELSNDATEETDVKKRNLETADYNSVTTKNENNYFELAKAEKKGRKQKSRGESNESFETLEKCKKKSTKETAKEVMENSSLQCKQSLTNGHAQETKTERKKKKKEEGTLIDESYIYNKDVASESIQTTSAPSEEELSIKKEKKKRKRNVDETVVMEDIPENGKEEKKKNYADNVESGDTKNGAKPKKKKKHIQCNINGESDTVQNIYDSSLKKHKKKKQKEEV